MELEPQHPNAHDPRKVIKERYEVDPETGCWEWSGHIKEGSGYGNISVNGETEYAHRVSYAVHNGEIPEGEWVLHECNNKSCVNPEHLYTGDVRDNVQDAMDEGSFWHDGVLSSGEDNRNSKLTENDVRQIKKLQQNTDLTYKEIGERFGICVPNVAAIVNGRTWSHVEVDDDPTDPEFEATYDPIHDLIERWGITFNEAEGFLEKAGYYGDPDNPDRWKTPHN